MLTAIMLFPADADTDAVSAHVDRLTQTLATWPGVESVASSAGPMMSPAGPPPYSRAVVATMSGLGAITSFGQAAETSGLRSEGEELGATVLFFQTGTG